MGLISSLEYSTLSEKGNILLEGPLYTYIYIQIRQLYKLLDIPSHLVKKLRRSSQLHKKYHQKYNSERRGGEGRGGGC